jgi:ATP dependent DNA ligase-like protein
VNNIWLKASRCLTYRRVVFLSVTEITGPHDGSQPLARRWRHRLQEKRLATPGSGKHGEGSQIAQRIAQQDFVGRFGSDWTRRYPWIAEAALKNRQEHFVIDGEAVVLGVDGISDFNALHSRKHDHEVQLYAFDILAMGGDDLRSLPLHMRKANLGELTIFGRDADPPRETCPWRDARAAR